MHPRSLISTFIVRCLDCITPLVITSEISRLLQVAVAEQTGLSHTWSKISEDTFSRAVAYLTVQQANFKSFLARLLRVPPESWGNYSKWQFFSELKSGKIKYVSAAKTQKKNAL